MLTPGGTIQFENETSCTDGRWQIPNGHGHQAQRLEDDSLSTMEWE